MARLLIAAAHKSSGKTSIVTGLAAALSRRGLTVQTFKKGPDYIDPLWLSRAAGQPCRNLDFHTMTHDEITNLFTRRDHLSDISLIEGNKGLYDGIDTEGCDGNAALAKLLSTPVILVIDTTGMTRGVAPLVLGYRDFDRSIDIKGVILNKVGGPRHEGKLRAALDHYTDIPVLGAIQRDSALEIPERHLGLTPVNEAVGAEAVIDGLCVAISAQVELDKITEIARAATPLNVARAATPLNVAGAATPLNVNVTTPPKIGATPPNIRIAIARDAAFGFYYPDDMEAFERAGATLVPFDTIHDKQLPDADGLFIGGGFPETKMSDLSANKGLLRDIRNAITNGMPAYAECGGLMYLARSIQWGGEYRDMCGVIPADVVVERRPQGRGYVVLEETGAGPWNSLTLDLPFSTIRAHEFHYARLENVAPDQTYAYHVKRGAGIDGRRDGLVINNLVANFMHLRDLDGSRWVNAFVDFVRAKQKSR
jgi:cobyrinic acid a,c-diamide synthase